jgi:hypothetical protein
MTTAEGMLRNAMEKKQGKDSHAFAEVYSAHISILGGDET